MLSMEDIKIINHPINEIRKYLYSLESSLNRFIISLHHLDGSTLLSRSALSDVAGLV